jgi:hypothetical protein
MAKEMLHHQQRSGHEALWEIARISQYLPACCFRLRYVCSGLGLMLLFTLPAVLRGQMQGHDPTFTSPNSATVSHEGMSDAAGRVDPVVEARRQQMQRILVRQSLEADSARLLELARELDDEIAKTQPDMLTQAELKRYAEIGKLARKMKSDMKSFQSGGATNLPLAAPVPAPNPNGSNQP